MHSVLKEIDIVFISIGDIFLFAGRSKTVLKYYEILVNIEDRFSLTE